MNYNLATTAGVLCDVNRLAYGKITGTTPEKHLTEHTELLIDLALCKERNLKNLTLDTSRSIDTKKWKQGKYVLHALFWSLRTKEKCSVILNEIPNDKIDSLQQALKTIKEYKKPTDEELEYVKEFTTDRYSRQNTPKTTNDPACTQKNNILKFSSYITMFVGGNWDAVKKEFDRWVLAIDERQKNPPQITVVPQQPQQMPERTTEPTSKEPQQTKKTPSSNQPPKKSTTTKTKSQKKSTTIDVTIGQVPGIFYDNENNELWSLEYLAKKMGLKNADVIITQRGKYIRSNKENNPEECKIFESYFCYAAPYGKRIICFYKKYFNDLITKMHHAPQISGDNTYKPNWHPVEELVKYLDFEKKSSFNVRKSNLKKQHPDLVNAWFTDNGKFFDFNKIHEIEKHLQSRSKKEKPQEQNTDAPEHIQTIIIEHGVGPVPTGNPVPQIEPIEEPAPTEPDVLDNNNPVVKETPQENNDATPTAPTTNTLVDMKALEVFLKTLNTALQQQEKKQEQIYKELIPVEERIETTKTAIQTAKQLMEDYQFFATGLQEATNKINAFLRDQQQVKYN